MGTIHQFKRPPKNKGQFRGMRPSGLPGAAARRGLWHRLRPWQKSLIAWVVLVAVAAGLVGVHRLFPAIF